MANTTISPNMFMPVPTVGVDPGPDWATNVDACLSIIDSHNHTSGQGVQITPAGMNINVDLPMNGNNLISVRSIRWTSQSVAISDPADLTCAYVLGGELFYIDDAGNQVQLTLNGSPAGATGTITGLPSGTASASFAGTTFTFQSATNTPASINGGPLKIAQAVVGGFGVTISADATQSGDYALTLPPALPSAQSYVTSDASGNLSFLYNGANVRGSEGAGTTTLASTDNFWQVFNLSAGRTVVLPSAGITAGQRFVMENVGNGALTVQSSNTNQVGVVDSLYSKLELVALINSPSTSAHWTTVLNYSQNIYAHGTTYNGGIAPTITGTGLVSVSYSQFIPYQLNDGSWRMTFNFYIIVSSSSRTTYTATINGVTFKNAANIAISGINDAATPAMTRASSNASTVIQNHLSNTTAEYGFSGDVQLNSKPTWAY